MEHLFAHIRQFVNVSVEAEKELKNILTVSKYPMGTILCDLGDIPTQVYFIKSGIVRGYAMSNKGTTYNRAIYKSDEFMASLTALIQKKKAELAIECLTDCEFIETNYYDFIKLGEKYPEIAKIYSKVLEENFIKLEWSNVQLATMNATERYLALRARIPRIDNQISQYHIASHLGITPIQLSRIRKGLLSSK